MKLKAQIVEKVWGRRDVPASFGDLRGKPIGEIWYDAATGDPLPLLVKWLFTSDKLSVQVHPDDAQARVRGLPSGKEECWYIVDAEPDARIGMGTIRPLDAEELRAASVSGEIEQLLDWKAVRAGDYFYIPAGTIHAIGAGITLIEVQQNADITYRLYDYQRMDDGKLRELHLDEGMAVADARPYTDPRSGSASGNMQLVNGPVFSMWLIESPDGLSMLPPERPLWITPIAGEAAINGATLKAGDCGMAKSLAEVRISGKSKMIIASI